MPPIQVQHAAQSFAGRTIFRDVTFDVAEGEIFAVLGGSGCGKSTLLRQMVGLLPPGAGRIALQGRDPREGLHGEVGVLFQSAALFGNMTLLENVMLPLAVHTDLPRAGREAVAMARLARVGLADAAGLRPDEASGGMAKRAGIARALALEPRLLFLDEPSAGLDPVTAAGLDRLILDLRRENATTCVVVTHELASIHAIADRCLMLDRDAQGVIALGPPAALRDSADPRVHAFFHREPPPAGAVHREPPPAGVVGRGRGA